MSERFSVVLCRPEGALNIGSVCRAMKTTGLDHLVIVDPLIDIQSDEVIKQIRQMAVHAFTVFQDAIVIKSLDEYRKECVLIAGMTRRQGLKRKFFSFFPEELALYTAEISEGRTALVFGNEQNGLNDDELALCDCAVQIPSSPDCPSLNLSHAVQIIAYTLYKEISESKASYSPINKIEVDALKEEFMAVLKEAGYFEKPDRFRTGQLLGDILSRSRMSSGEAKHLDRILKKLRYLIRDKKTMKESGPGDEGF